MRLCLTGVVLAAVAIAVAVSQSSRPPNGPGPTTSASGGQQRTRPEPTTTSGGQQPNRPRPTTTSGGQQPNRPGPTTTSGEQQPNRDYSPTSRPDINRSSPSGGFSVGDIQVGGGHILDDIGPESDLMEPRLMGSFVCKRSAHWQPDSNLGDVCGNDSSIFLFNPTDEPIPAGEVSFFVTPQCGSRNIVSLSENLSFDEIPSQGNVSFSSADHLSTIETPSEGLPCGIGCILANVSHLPELLTAVYEIPCGEDESDVKLEIQNYQAGQQPLEVEWGQLLTEVLGDSVTFKVVNLGSLIKARSPEIALSVTAFLRKKEFNNLNLTQYSTNEFAPSWNNTAVYNDRPHQYGDDEVYRRDASVNPVQMLFNKLMHQLEERSKRPRECQVKFPMPIDLDVMGSDVLLSSELFDQDAELDVDISKIRIANNAYECEGEYTLIVVVDPLEMLNDIDLCNNFVEIPIFLKCPNEFPETPQCEIRVDPRTKGQNMYILQSNNIKAAFRDQQWEKEPRDSYEKFSELKMFKVMEKRLLRMAKSQPGMCHLAQMSQQKEERDFLRMETVDEDRLRVNNIDLNPEEAYNNLKQKLDELYSADSFEHGDYCQMYRASDFTWIFMVMKDYEYFQKFTHLINRLISEFQYNPEEEDGCHEMWTEAANQDLSLDNWYMRGEEDMLDIMKLMTQNIHLSELQANFLKGYVLQQISRPRFESNGTHEISVELNKTLDGKCPAAFQTSKLAKLNKFDQLSIMFDEYLRSMMSGSVWNYVDDEDCGQALIQYFVSRGGSKFINKRGGWAKEKPIQYYSSLYEKFLVKLSARLEQNLSMAENFTDVLDVMKRILNETIHKEDDLCEDSSPKRNADDVLPMYWKLREGKILQGIRTPLDGDFGREGGKRKALWNYVATCGCPNCWHTQNPDTGPVFD